MVRDNTGKPVDYIFLEINSSFEALTGLPRDHIIGKKVTELYPGIKGLGFDWIGVFDQVTAIGTDQNIHFQQYLDQQDRWYEITAYSDQPGYFAVVFRDITKRKQAEEKLFETKEYLENLIKYANAPIIVWDTSLSITRFNQAFENLSGYDASEVIGKKIDILFSKNKIESTLEHIQKTSSGERWEAVEIEIQRKDGEPRIVLWNSANILDTERNNVIATIAQGQDITERKQAEVALRKSERNLAAIMNASTESIFLMDLEGGLLAANESLAQRLGTDLETLLRGNFYEFLPPDVAKNRKLHVKQVIKSGKPLYFEDERFGRTILNSLYPIFDSKGQIIRLAVGGMDITERKQAELLILIQRDLALAISFSHQLDKALTQCLDTMLQLSEMDCGRIYLIDQASGDLNLICHRNLSPAFIKSVSHYKADSAHVRLVLQGKPIFTRYSEFDLPLDEVRKAEKLLAFAVVPLIFENRVIGCLNLGSKKLEDVSEIDREVLKTAATLMGEGIIRLEIEEELKLSYQKLQKAMKSTIQAIALILEKRDPYTAGHQKRVTKLACAIAEEISIFPDKIEGLYIAGIIHDIGKINVPTEILSKPGKLSEIELSLIQTHPQVGSDILKEMELPGEISSIVLQHHERMDGSGYPFGLSGEAILLEARILAVADVVEAMASHRPYRPALGLDKAWEEITKNKGKLYDPEVVDACLKLFKEKGFKF
jgi:PAS domain S-box-containing protein/putative nucleotidyltransferase with HDIG domain